MKALTNIAFFRGTRALIGWIGFNDLHQEGTWVWYDGSQGKFNKCMQRTALGGTTYNCLFSVYHWWTFLLQLSTWTGKLIIQIMEQSQIVLQWELMESGTLWNVNGVKGCFLTSVRKVHTHWGFRVPTPPPRFDFQQCWSWCFLEK